MAINRVGPYSLDVPDFFTSFDVRANDPLHAANAIVDAGVTFDFTFVIGGASEDERDDFLDAMVDALQPEQHDVTDGAVRGNPFQVHQLELGRAPRRNERQSSSRSGMIFSASTCPSQRCSTNLSESPDERPPYQMPSG